MNFTIEKGNNMSYTVKELLNEGRDQAIASGMRYDREKHLVHPDAQESDLREAFKSKYSSSIRAEATRHKNFPKELHVKALNDKDLLVRSAALSSHHATLDDVKHGIDNDSHLGVRYSANRTHETLTGKIYKSEDEIEAEHASYKANELTKSANSSRTHRLASDAHIAAKKINEKMGNVKVAQKHAEKAEFHFHNSMS